MRMLFSRFYIVRFPPGRGQCRTGNPAPGRPAAWAEATRPRQRHAEPRSPSTKSATSAVLVGKSGALPTRVNRPPSPSPTTSICGSKDASHAAERKPDPGRRTARPRSRCTAPERQITSRRSSPPASARSRFRPTCCRFPMWTTPHLYNPLQPAISATADAIFTRTTAFGGGLAPTATEHEMLTSTTPYTGAALTDPIYTSMMRVPFSAGSWPSTYRLQRPG